MARDQDANDRTMVERIDPLLGSVLDRRYKIDFRLAAGGFGAIYRATHIKSAHEVALKVLHPQLTADAGVVARFRREGATMTTLRSPHTITAYELGEADDGTLYIVMELLKGESLFERFRAHGRFEWKRMVKIARAICDSLGEAHRLGIVHRDLKPTNIHLEPKGEDPDFVKVLDFGIAKILRDSDFDSSDLTNAGQMIGTLDYMSPEQMVGGTCTGQSDIYTLGILTYEMIAGVRPFAEAQSAAAALAAILRTVPPPLSKRTPVPEDLDRILARCLERDPLQRYATVAELAGELDQLIAAQDIDEVTHAVAIDPLDLAIAPDPGAKAAKAHGPEPRPSVRPRPPSAPPPVPTSGEYTWNGDVPRSDSGRTKAPTGMPRSEPGDPLFSSQPTTPNPVVPRAAVPRRTPTAAPLPRPETDYAVTTPVPKFSRAPTTPPTGMPSASPFKTTLPGAHMPPNPNARPSQPVFSPPSPYAQSPSYPHTSTAVAAYPPMPQQAPRFPPTPMAGQNFPPTPMAGQQNYPPLGQNFPPTPMAGPGNFPPTPLAGQQPYAPQPIDDGRGSRPVLDLNSFPQQRTPAQGGYPQQQQQQQPGGAFDMGQLQARDAAMRSWVWIAVLVVGAIVGIVLAARM